MRLSTVQRILGILLMLFSFTLLPPIIISGFYADGEMVPFTKAFAFAFVLGAFVWWPVRRVRQELRLRDGFLIVVLFWTVLSIIAAIPLALANGLELSITDAFFESISGLTTTGATILSQIDGLPKSILFYRQQLQWFGGMGMAECNSTKRKHQARLKTVN
jgi:trk system potassium uptake protein TrkH